MGLSIKIATVRRILFNAFSAFSLLLCITSATLWARSWWFVDEWRVGRSRQYQRSDFLLGTTWGQMRIGTFHERTAPPGSVVDLKWGPDFEHVQSRGGMNDVRGPLLPNLDRYQWSGGTGGRWVEFDTVRLPLWLVTLLFAIAPLLWLRQAIPHWVAAKRTRAGRCPACGYDLTANTSGACPECGQRIGRKGAPQRRGERRD